MAIDWCCTSIPELYIISQWVDNMALDGTWYRAAAAASNAASKAVTFNPPPPPTQCLFNVQQFLPRIDTPNTPLPQEERRGEVDTASTHSWLGTKMRRRTDEHCKKLSVIPTRTLCDQAITFYEEPWMIADEKWRLCLPACLPTYLLCGRLWPITRRVTHKQLFHCSLGRWLAQRPAAPPLCGSAEA